MNQARLWSSFPLLFVLLSCAPRITRPTRASVPLSEHADHPLAPLTAGELGAAFSLLLTHFRDDAALPKQPLRFALAALAEPPKAFVASWRPGQPLARRAELHVLHHPSNRAWVALVDLSAGRVVQLEQLPPGTQPAVTEEEYDAAEAAVRAYPPWQEAMRARGIEPAEVQVDVWAAGDQPLPAAAAALSHGEQTRLLRSLFFLRGPRGAEAGARSLHPYVRPIEGVVVTIDMNARRVVHMSDTHKRPVIDDPGALPGKTRLRPLHVLMPEGSDIQLRGRLVRWHNWQFYVVLHPREGLVLYDVRFDDHGSWRPIAYRLSLSEIYVPYGLGEENWSWRSAFDVGEYNAGMFAQPLEVDRDLPENAILLDNLSFSDLGPSAENPSGGVPLPRTIGLYERDAGILWTRTDPATAARDTRFARELVVTWNCWIGNYIYGFDWTFKLDGTLDVRVRLTGTLLNRGAELAAEASAPKVARDPQGVLIAAPNHQHFFSFRLDLDVDGAPNHVMEMEVAHLPETGFKSSFDAVTTHIAAEGQRYASPFSLRHWHVESATRSNGLGKPTGYALDPGELAVPYSAPDYAPLERAKFAQHALWFTRYRDGELYAAGRFPNQSKVEDGVAAYVREAEPLAGHDVVLWYTTGLTHIARPEDHPVMPTESVGFRLAPRGFFRQNPALDLVDQAASEQGARQ